MKVKHFNHNRFTKNKMWAYDIPEHSVECFADALTKIIKASGITQKELAKALRVSNTTIMNYCEGLRKNPTKEFIIEIADFFDIKPSYFLEYRIYQLMQRIEANPELIDVFLDLATSPVRLLKEYKRIQKEMELTRYNYNSNDEEFMIS